MLSIDLMCFALFGSHRRINNGTSTTDFLSERNSTRLDDQCWPHTFAVLAIGNNSLCAMEKPSWYTDHARTGEPMGHKDSPITNSIWGIWWNLESHKGAHCGARKKLCPLHNVKNSQILARSRWNSRLRRIGWSSRRNAVSRSIIPRRKVQRWEITLQAWWRWPTKDSSTFLVMWRLLDQDASSDAITSNLLFGIRACSLIVSNSISRITIQVVGHPIYQFIWVNCNTPLFKEVDVGV